MPEPQTMRNALIPQTSICTPFRHPDEVTVRFTRWTTHGNTAYQKGQYAGFLRREADALVKAGKAVLHHMAEPAAPAVEAADGAAKRKAA